MQSMKQYSTLTSIAVAVVRAARHYHVNCDQFFAKAGLDVEATRNPNARYPDPGLNRLIELAASASNDPAFGLLTGRHIAPTSLHALGFSLLASDTLRAALQRLVRYFRIVSDATEFEIEKNKKDYTVRISFLSIVPEERVDFTVVVLLELCRQLLGPEFDQCTLRLPADRAVIVKPLQQDYAINISADTEQIEFRVEKALAERELPTGNPELAYQNDKIVADYLARSDSERLSERVRAIFMDRMVTGKFTEQQIAEQLDLSLRSLQRRLREERTTYQQLLDETRLELALQYINRTQLSVSQIAPLLGFSDSSNFNRAFKRWLGLPPSRYRAAGFQ